MSGHMKSDELIEHLKSRFRDNFGIIIWHKINCEHTLQGLQEQADELKDAGAEVPQELIDKQKKYEELLFHIERAFDACSILIENPLDKETFAVLIDAEEKAGIE